MSLILEALKKLDREKQAPDRGVVIVGPSAWPSPREGVFTLRGAGLVLAAVLLGAAAGTVWLIRARYAAEPPAQPVLAGAPAQPAQAVPAPDARPPLSAAMPPKAEAARPVGPARARGPAAVPKARPEPAPGTDEAPAAEGTEATPPDLAEAGATPAEAPTPEPPPSRSAARRPGSAEFELQAISAQNGQPVALLNDRLVHEGDTFDNVKVVRIGVDEVEIEVAGRRRIVKF